MKDRQYYTDQKCEMARLFYCRHATMGFCIADDRELKKCPYLEAIGEIARLSIENMEVNKHESI